jgi:hypothetical protein
MQERWRSRARAAAEAAFDARAAHDKPPQSEPATAQRFRAHVRIDSDRFTTMRTQRQISMYLLHRSLSADQRNRQGLEWWREALRHGDAELENKQKP